MISVCFQDEEEEIKLEINVLKKVRHMLASWAIEHLVGAWLGYVVLHDRCTGLPLQWSIKTGFHRS